jgi:RNA polymerase-binding transcription factor DksA
VSEVVRRELAEIDAALLRIELGLYGTCLGCGGPMGLQRLRALPEARYCVACSGSRPPLD